MQRRISYHIIFWVAYLLFKTYLQFDFTADKVTPELLMKVIGGQAAYLAVKIPMVYSLFFIIDKYISRQWEISKLNIAVSALFAIGIAVFLPVKQFIVLRTIYGRDATMQEVMNFTSIFSALFLLGFVCSIAVAIKLVRAGIRQRKLQQEMIQSKLETELQFLKAQINPHFLFNTLNNIYALARKKADETPDVVMKLSKLFRFILYEASKKSIPISQEIQVLQDYIELERIRYNNKLEIDFNRSVDNGMQPIAPLILLPFVENAFKHGASENRFNTFIRINLEVKNNKLFFTCENSKTGEMQQEEAGRIGLANIRRQLELLYPDHTLKIDNADTVFKVTLTLNLETGNIKLTPKIKD